MGLGRGLESLIPSKKQKDTKTASNFSKIKESVVNLYINSISPNPQQPRQQFDKQTLQELADSIKKHGIIQPLVVSKVASDSYQLIAGQRRWLAAKLLKLREVPAIIRDVNEQEKLEIALVENIQRHDLNPIEEAKAYQKLSGDFNLTQEQIAKKLAKSRAAITNSLRLLTLPEEIQKAIFLGKITEGHAKAILGLDSKEKQLALFKKIITFGLTVRETETGVKKIKIKSFYKKRKDSEVSALEDRLREFLSTKVNIEKKGKGGRIFIEFYSKEELEGIVGRIISEDL